MGGKSSKQEERKEGKESKKKEAKEESTTAPSPPVSYSKPIPASTTPPPPVPSPITVTELDSSPRNGRKGELVVPKPHTIYNPKISSMVASTPSLYTQHTPVVSGLMDADFTNYLTVKGKSKSKNKRQSRKAALNSSSSPPRSSSSSPTANSTGRLRKRRRWYQRRRNQKKPKKEKQRSKPAISKKKRSNSASESGGSPKGNEYVEVKKSSESENEDVNKTEQPLEELTKTEPNPVHEEPAQNEETSSTAPESNAPIFQYKEKEEEEFTIIDVPGIVPVEVKERDNEYLEITIIND